MLLITQDDNPIQSKPNENVSLLIALWMVFNNLKYEWKPTPELWGHSGADRELNILGLIKFIL